MSAVDPTTEGRVDRLFARFAAIYGPRWISAMSDERIERLAVTEWAPLVAALSDAQIRAAIDAAKASCEWPPSIGEFARLALELPDPAVAASRAARGEKDDLSRTIRRRAGGTHTVQTADAREATRLCQRVYGELVQDLVGDAVRGQSVDVGAALAPPAPPQASIESKRTGAQAAGVAVPAHLRGGQ